MPIEEEIMENLRKCPHFDRCSQNFCPLDLELHLRKGSASDKCRWMREAKKTKVNGREFISGGGVMPDAILKFVPEGNVKWLNEVSQKRWQELKSNIPIRRKYSVKNG
ncbi:MAG: hypothetical protein ACPLXB_01205 [Minisyncoccia bacterium]